MWLTLSGIESLEWEYAYPAKQYHNFACLSVSYGVKKGRQMKSGWDDRWRHQRTSSHIWLRCGRHSWPLRTRGTDSTSRSPKRTWTYLSGPVLWLVSRPSDLRLSFPVIQGVFNLSGGTLLYPPYHQLGSVELVTEAPSSAVPGARKQQVPRLMHHWGLRLHGLRKAADTKAREQWPSSLRARATRGLLTSYFTHSSNNTKNPTFTCLGKRTNRNPMDIIKI